MRRRSLCRRRDDNRRERRDEHRRHPVLHRALAEPECDHGREERGGLLAPNKGRHAIQAEPSPVSAVSAERVTSITQGPVL